MLIPYSGKLKTTRKKGSKWGSKRHMTPLERGLALSARREGMTIAKIAKALKRSEHTIIKLLRKTPSIPRTIGAIRRGLNASKSLGI